MHFVTAWGRRLVMTAVALLAISPLPALQGCGGGGCCKVCDSGKACGDTCIAANETCHASEGCACNK